MTKLHWQNYTDLIILKMLKMVRILENLKNLKMLKMVRILENLKNLKMLKIVKTLTMLKMLKMLEVLKMVSAGRAISIWVFRPRKIFSPGAVRK